MSGAKLFLSTDGNAPVLAGSDMTCLVRLFKSCLIEGYGDTRPVGGWTMPYGSSDGRRGVFRNDVENGGLGHYLRVSQESNTGRVWKISAYENMTSDSEGTFPYGSAEEISTSASNNTTPRPWVLLASRTWFAVFIYLNNTNYPTKSDASPTSWVASGLWFGDIEKWNLSDNYNSMLSLFRGGSMQFGATSNSSSNTINTATLSQNYRFPRKSDGIGGNPCNHLCYVPHPQTNAVFGGAGPEHSSSSGLLFGRAALNDGQANTLRGWIPDMIVPLHNLAFDHLETVETMNKMYKCILFNVGHNTSSGHKAQALFEIESIP